MADKIISINSKLKLAEDKREQLVLRHKILTVQKVFQCTQCAFKCEKCGAQIAPVGDSSEEETKEKVNPNYRFCESCLKEYEEYIEQVENKKKPVDYWQNKDWQNVWRTWIEYHKAINKYIKSNKFKQLINELRRF